MITVLTSQYDASLPRDEMQAGVRVVRVPVALRLSKAPVMPGLLWQAARLLRQADVIDLVVPQMDAAPLALLSRLLGKPVVMTYICDLNLPPGLLNSLANLVTRLADRVCGWAANSITAMSQDYAEHSAFLRRQLPKVCVVDAPVSLVKVSQEDVQAFRAQHHLQPGQPVIGMAARLAAEKGVEYLVKALPAVLAEHPQARVLFMGPHQGVLGEEAYARQLAPAIAALGPHWTFLGVVSEHEKSCFFKACDLTVLPSTNSTEAFGMVQVEAMMSGTPVIATDLPGVRQPVLNTGMGRIIPPRDAGALTQAILDLLGEDKDYTHQAELALERYAPHTAAAAYEAIYEELTR
jgi:glycosyltransferase involved in cell wall biosynthesis